MTVLTIITIITLVISGLFHFYWAFGGEIGLDRVIPIKDGKALLNPGKILTIIVGLIIFGFAWIAYLLYFIDLSTTFYGKQIIYVGWLLSGIFIIRAIGDFHTVGFFKKIKSTKFAEFDTKYFAPLTLFWGISFMVLTYQV